MIDRFEQFSSAMSGINQCILKLQREEMEKYGLKGVYAQYLSVLSHYPDGLTSAQLCECCDKDKAAISRVVTELERRGLAGRVGTTGTTYRAPVKLTEKGREVAAFVRRRAELAVNAASCGLSDENRAVMYQSLEIIAKNLQTLNEEGIPEDKK